MKLYIATCCDRHSDPVVRVFDTPNAAVAYARRFAYNYAAHKERIVESAVPGTLFYSRFSTEEDYVEVTEGLLNDKSL